MGEVHAFPGVALAAPDRPPLNLTPDEVEEACGGYKRPKDQLRVLHALGFTRAHNRGPAGRVVLERAHYEAVSRGQFGTSAANESTPRPRARPDRAAFRAALQQKKGAK